ncbi:MAG: P27 family phage terminase small subunit [Eubacteriales bacterium]|nr:P27 family phage terminase small subunit [Eubacteriales bacterium]
MGRPRKPLDLQSGNLTNQYVANRKREEEAVKVEDSSRLQKPPKHLCAEAKKEWKMIVNTQKDFGMLSSLDYNALDRYCTLVVAVRKLEKTANEKEGEDFLEAVESLRKLSPELTKLENRLHMSASDRLKFAAELVKKEDSQIEDKFGEI